MKRYECSVTPKRKIPGFKEKQPFTKELTYDEIRHCIIHNAEVRINTNHGMSQIITDLRSLDNAIKLSNVCIGVVGCGSKISDMMEDIVKISPTNSDDEPKAATLEEVVDTFTCGHVTDPDENIEMESGTEIYSSNDITSKYIFAEYDNTKDVTVSDETTMPLDISVSVATEVNNNSNQPKNNNNKKYHGNNKHRR